MSGFDSSDHHDGTSQPSRQRRDLLVERQEQGLSRVGGSVEEGAEKEVAAAAEATTPALLVGFRCFPGAQPRQ